MLAPQPAARSPLVVHTPLLIDALRRLGCTVDLASWGGVGPEPLWRRAVDRAAAIHRIRRRLRAQRYDVLVVKTAHDWRTLGRDLPLLAWTRDVCRHRILQLHGSQADALPGTGREAFRRASRALAAASDAVLVLSREEQRHWQAACPGTPVHVVRNPFLPPAVPPPPAPRQRLGVPEHVPVVLYVGRLQPLKGIDDLLVAAARAFAHRPAHLLIVGEGPERAALERQASAPGLRGSVTFTGHVAGETLAAAYAAADVFALASRSEGFPTAILEAMAAGLPIVTTAIRGMRDHLQEGSNGLLVAPGDPAALAAALGRLLADADLRARMGAANRPAIAAFHPDRVATQYLAVLERVVAPD